MVADLQSIGTYGWFPSQAVSSQIQAVGTYGWFLDFAAATPVGGDLIEFCLNITRTVLKDFEI